MNVSTKYAMNIEGEYVLAGVELSALQLSHIALDPKYFEHTTITAEEYEAQKAIEDEASGIVDVEVTEPVYIPFSGTAEYNTLEALSDEDLGQMHNDKFGKMPAHNALKATIINKLLSNDQE